MPTVSRPKLGRELFEHRIAVKSHPDVGPNGSTTVRRLIIAPGGVTYAPYAVDEHRQKIADGRDATSVLLGTNLVLEESRQCSFRVLNGYPGNKLRDATGSGHVFSMHGTLPTQPGTFLPLAQALAAENFLSNYYEATRSIRGASSVAEALSTVRGLASPAKALRKEVDNLYSSLRKRAYRSDGRALKDAAKAIAGTWLEWNFGIKPLVQDVNGAADAVNKLTMGDFRATVPVTGNGIDKKVISQSVNQGVTAGAGTPYATPFGMVDTWYLDETICTIRGAVRVAKPGGEIPPVMQFGVGFEDIAPAVWEGIPWSFFYDYFFNTSSVIDAWSFMDSRLSWCNRTIRNSRVMMVSDVRPNKDSSFGLTYSKYQASGGRAKARFTSVSRAPVAWEDVAPTLRIQFPGFGTKWANLTALSAMYTPPRGEVEWKKLRRRKGPKWRLPKNW